MDDDCQLMPILTDAQLRASRDSKVSNEGLSAMRLSLRSARSSLRRAHRELVFARALRRLEKDPERVLRNDQNLLSDLVYGWGNEGWSGQREYLAACVEAALNTHGPILECGSGLTTLILGIVAKRSGARVWTLEHIPDWAQRVQARLDRQDIQTVRLNVAPLQRYGSFDWYRAPANDAAEPFTLVICDGPPAAAAGGRYGLLPVMAPALADACLILVDDAEREAEQTMVRRWAAEVPCTVSLHGTEKPYFRVQMHAREV